jgi:apolipoprotein D and lipocalin family protein
MTRYLMLLLALSVGAAEVSTVGQIDLKRYAGKWYEVARLPNRFQRKCAGNVTATYELKSDGKLRVVNECKKIDGGQERAEGTAKLAKKGGPNSKLKVSFFWPFYGDYWVIDLDKEYRWAAVASPDRKYFWILSRTKELDAGTTAGILERAKGQGFVLERLIRTPQG